MGAGFRQIERRAEGPAAGLIESDRTGLEASASVAVRGDLLSRSIISGEGESCDETNSGYERV
ncbi:hypothetical protein [Microbacterium sp. A93]|uniref:hypothetical protein n=1 Tax=Microbacterium sp. A93 TaxID=3450716 RepID=UPI003F42E1AA